METPTPAVAALVAAALALVGPEAEAWAADPLTRYTLERSAAVYDRAGLASPEALASLARTLMKVKRGWVP